MKVAVTISKVRTVDQEEGLEAIVSSTYTKEM